MDPAGRLSKVAPVALLFAVTLHAFGFVVVGFHAMAVSSNPRIGVRLRLDLRQVVVAHGTLAGRFAVIVACEARLHGRIIVLRHPLRPLRLGMATAAVFHPCIVFFMREFYPVQIGLHRFLFGRFVAARAAHVHVALHMAHAAPFVHCLHAAYALVALAALFDAAVVAFAVVACNARNAGLFERAMRQHNRPRAPAHLYGGKPGVLCGNE